MKLSDFELHGESNGSADIADDKIILTARARTDWFHHPADKFRKADVVSASTLIDADVFSLSACVAVSMASPYDAGAVFLQVDEENWAKVAFEYSGCRKPTIVSVVTRTTSDDVDGPVVENDRVWLRLYCDGETVAFHYSLDGKFWNFFRWFAIPGITKRPLRVGFGGQSPTGEGSSARFSDVELRFEKIADLRDGS